MFTRYLTNALKLLICIVLVLYIISFLSFCQGQGEIIAKAGKELHEAMKPPSAAELQREQRSMDQMDRILTDMERLTANSIQEEEASKRRQAEIERRRIRESYP